jgi:hypothetical protein
MTSHSHEHQTPLADTREAAIRQICNPVAAFKPGMENLVAGVIIGMLLATGGGVFFAFALREAIVNGSDLPWFAAKGPCLAAVLGGAAIALLAAGGGVAIILWVRALFSLRVLVGSEGFLCISRKEVQVFPWGQIDSVRETVTQEYFPLKGVAKYAAPMGQSRCFVVRRRDGVEFGFDGNTVKKLGTLARMIEEATRRRGIPWEVVRQ